MEILSSILTLLGAVFLYIFIAILVFLLIMLFLEGILKYETNPSILLKWACLAAIPCEIIWFWLFPVEFLELSNLSGLVLALSILASIIAWLMEQLILAVINRQRLEHGKKPLDSLSIHPVAVTIVMLLAVMILTFLPLRTAVFPESYYEADSKGFESYALEDLQRGGMKFEYPVYLLPSSSEVVTLTITPDMDVHTNLPDIFQRVPIPAKEPLLIGEYYDYVSNILVAPEMRATLESEGIKVTTLANDGQPTNFEGSNLWSWMILAPDQVGTHPLYLSLYLGDNIQPIWSFFFTLSVTTPTPVPSATPTGTPAPTPFPSLTPTKTTGQQLKEVTISKAPDLIASMLNFWGVIIGAVLVFIGTVIGKYMERAKSDKSQAPGENSATKPSMGEPPQSPQAPSLPKANELDEDGTDSHFE